MLLAVTNRFLCKEPFLERIKKIAKEEKADYLILREKDLEQKQYYSLVETAQKLFVDAIHFPFSIFKEKYLSLSEEEKQFFTLVGVSVHTVEEAIFVEKHGGSYLMAGHIFATDCKKGLTPRGIEFLKEICENVSIPVYAIGGITLERMQVIQKAGACGGAIMSGFMKDECYL